MRKRVFLGLFLVVYLPIRPTIVQWDVGLGILSDTQVTSLLLVQSSSEASCERSAVGLLWRTVRPFSAWNAAYGDHVGKIASKNLPFLTRSSTKVSPALYVIGSLRPFRNRRTSDVSIGVFAKHDLVRRMK